MATQVGLIDWIKGRIVIDGGAPLTQEPDVEPSKEARECKSSGTESRSIRATLFRF